MNISPGTAALGTALLIALPASAAIPREGDYDIVGCYHGPAYVNAFSKEVMAGSQSLAGMVVAKPDSVWHNVSGRCNGAWQVIDGEFTEIGSCDYVDLDGDHFFGIFSRKNLEGKWKVYGGTGKFVGMEQSGVWKPLGEYAQVAGEYRGCFQQSGHWKLK